MSALGDYELERANKRIDEAVQRWEIENGRRAEAALTIRDAVVIGTLELMNSRPNDEIVTSLLVPSPLGIGPPLVYPLSLDQAKLVFLETHLHSKYPRYLRMERELKHRVGQLIGYPLPLKGEIRQELVDIRKRLHFQRESLAMLLTYRAYLLQRLRKFDESERVRGYVLGLGYEPEELLARIPNTDLCIYYLITGPVYLDTRGFIRTKLGETDQAVRDLDLAVRGTEVVLETEKVNNIFSGIAIQAKQRIDQTLETRLVILEHRRQAWLKVDPFRARMDLEELRELGVRPGQLLY